MLVSPLADPTGWLWTHVDVADLPGALLGQFPPTEASAAGSALPPSALPPGVSGAGPATALRFPWTGRARCLASGDALWIWGSNGDLPRFPELRAALPFGNPLIALRFTSAELPSPGRFPDESVRRQAPVVLSGSSSTTVTDLTIVAAYPRRPGMDTLSVLRHLRDALNVAFPAEHAEHLLATSWAAFVDPLDSLAQRLRLLEASGAPVPTRSLTLNRAAGPHAFELSAVHRGDLVAASGLDRAAFDASDSIDVAGGAEVAAATPASSFPSGAVTIAPADSHIDLAVLDEWFAANGSAALPRFTRNNRVVPLIHGPAYYANLFTELNAIVAPGTATADGLFYLSGSTFAHDKPLIPASLGLSHRTLADVTRSVAAGGAEARFLALQLVQLQPGVLETVEVSASVAGSLLSFASVCLAGIAEHGWDQANFLIHTQLIAWAMIVGAPMVGSLVSLFETNKRAIDALAGIASVEAHLDPYIATAADNPLGPAPGANLLIDAVRLLQERFGLFHQTIAIVRNGTGLHAYCGGIDLNPNRLDNRDHGIRHPYHDVHARIDGPAAADLARTFVERWQTAGRSTLAIGAPGGIPVVPAAGTDVVQVGRTYFRAAAGSSGLPFAPSGERTILDTQLAAISRARRYIYIEDECLTPPAEYVDALTAAASRVSGPLIIVVPEVSDQPFGRAPRQRFISSMKAAWGDRFKVGTLRMRFSAAPTSVSSATGRLWLTRDVAEADTTIEVGPGDRLPGLPCWLVVGNEVMRATRKISSSSSVSGVELAVQRAEATRLFTGADGTDRKRHKSRAAVLCGGFPGVYVHAKTMLIDDTFASIGSAGVSRRGYYGDGECNVFALRESLTHGDNWIRDLRVRLWAEALGITEEYARVALANPGARMELWERRFTTGNRFTPFEAQLLTNELELQTAVTSNSSALDILGFSAAALAGVADAIVGANADVLFDTVLDPSSRVAPP